MIDQNYSQIVSQTAETINGDESNQDVSFLDTDSVVASTKTGTRSCCGFMKVFMLHTLKSMMHNKFHFCLAFLAVFIVVWTSLLIQTVVSQAPIIFMKVAETQEGEYDAFLVPNEFAGIDIEWRSGDQKTQLNFTKM